MALIFIATWISPLWIYEQSLHSSLTIIGFYLMYYYSKKGYLSDLDFFLIALFLSIHSIGAHWLYSNVPYEEWLKSLFGTTLKELFGWERNHYDRLVHFSYGFLFTSTLLNYYKREFGVTFKHASFLAISVIIVSSVAYEWFEWIIAIGLSPLDAEAYNGQQGDSWDAHKDMLLATLGSISWVLFAKRTQK